MAPQAADLSLHPVLATVLERKAQHSRPQHRLDSFRVALVVEGGAMRGVVSAGMLASLEALGLRNSFDAVYGTSAGALNAACFLAGQAALGVAHYAQRFSSESFLDLRAALRGQPAVDLDALFDDLSDGRFPLAFDAIVRGRIPLVALAAEVLGECGPADPAARLRRLTSFADLNDLISALHASARLPILAGNPVVYRGMRLLDGGILADVPVQTAIADGYDRVLVLVTLPAGAQRSKLAALFESMYITPRLRTLDPALAAAFASRHQRYRATLAFLRSKRDNPTGPAYVTLITLPSAGPKISAFETRTDKLALGAAAGADAVRVVLGSGAAA